MLLLFKINSLQGIIFEYPQIYPLDHFSKKNFGKDGLTRLKRYIGSFFPALITGYQITHSIYIDDLILKTQQAPSGFAWRLLFDLG
jgi:hypothetical protein